MNIVTFRTCSHHLPLLCSLLHRIIEMNNNSPPLTFKRFETIVSRLELPRRPLPPITQQQMDKCRTKIADNHDQLYSIPSLEELGMIVFGMKVPPDQMYSCYGNIRIPPN